MKVWVKTDVAPEGKYLVVRRDGTIPTWPHFVLGGDDENSPASLRAYADEGEKNGLDPEYVASVRELADEYETRAIAIANGTMPGKPDPDAPPHRKDNPAVVAMMRGVGDLSGYGMKSGRMVQIADYIAELQAIMERWGNTCVYIRDASWITNASMWHPTRTSDE